MIKVNIKDRLTQVVIFCIVFTLALILLHLFVGRSAIKYADRIKAEWKAKQIQLQESEKMIKALPNPRKAIEELKKKFSDLSEVGGGRKQIPRLVQILGKSTSDSNIRVFGIKPRDDIKSSGENLPTGVSKAFIEMGLMCTYKAFAEYLKALSGLQPGFTVESFEMQKPPESQPARTSAKAQSPDKVPEKREMKDPVLLIKLIVSSYMIWEL